MGGRLSRISHADFFFFITAVLVFEEERDSDGRI